MAQLGEVFKSIGERYFGWVSLPMIMWTDIVEIIIISFLVYHVLVWIKNTRAWSLLRGIVIILVFVFLAALFDMTTILWIAKNVTGIAVTALLIVFQPELRKALEQLGKTTVLSGLIQFDNGRVSGEMFSDKTIDELIRASYEMGKAKTGALIVVQNKDPLTEYELTGILIDALVSSQLLINIFEHNTPLHDGAVVVKGNRVVAATCYLPLSDNMELSKELGTRHRAGVGISEATDSLTIIVSEETGRVSVAMNGELHRNIDADFLRSKLAILQSKTIEEKKKILFWKGRSRNETKADK
ncbi:MAG: diadenylate cyclase CdaA [Lachnospiraceae bacterium]|nr:diadenylate cyclase CdaA [Lachnospiraceae bacterium]MBR6486064.1 diadenylate cyclase CdaA [Lachnospiraceae bacterium]